MKIRLGIRQRVRDDSYVGHCSCGTTSAGCPSAPVAAGWLLSHIGEQHPRAYPVLIRKVMESAEAPSAAAFAELMTRWLALPNAAS